MNERKTSSTPKTHLLYSEQFNLFSATLAEFVGQILIERNFFQNYGIPQRVLLSIANNFIQLLTLEKKPKTYINMYQEGVILYKQLSGKELTPEEERYEKAVKKINVVGEIFNGISYGLFGKSLSTSITAVIEKSLWSHLPAIVGYTSLSFMGPQLIPLVVEKTLSYYSGLTEKQRKILALLLSTLGKLVLGFVPKAHANDKGAHYQYPSTAGHSQTYTENRTITLEGDKITLQQRGTLETPEGDFESQAEINLKLDPIQTLTEEKIGIQVSNYEGKKIPVEFQVIQNQFGREIIVNCPDKELEAHWQSYFPSHVEAEKLTSTETTINANKEITASLTTNTKTIHPTTLSTQQDFSQYSALTLGLATSIFIQHPLPVLMATLNYLPKALATSKKHALEQQTTTSPFNLVNLPLNNQAQDIFTENNYVYTVDTSGLTIFDASNPNNIVNVSQYKMLGGGKKLLINNGYAYVIDGLNKLQIINIKNVNAPQWAGMWATTNPITDVTITNNKAYITDGTNMVTEIDISTPEAVYQAFVPMSPYCNYPIVDISVANGLAYIACQSDGVSFVNVSDPINPQVLGSFSNFTADALAVSGNLVYGADRSRGIFYIIDATNPTAPQLLSTLPIKTPYAIAVEVNTAYIANYSSVSAINVTDPKNPQLLSTLPVSSAYDIAIAGNTGYVNGNFFYIINVTDPKNLQSLSATLIGVPTNQVTLSANLAYVGGSIFNVSNSTNPKQLSTLIPTTNNVPLSGNIAYLPENTVTLAFDVSNPNNPKLLNILNLNAENTIAISNNFIYAVNSQGLFITQANPYFTPVFLGFANQVNQLGSVNNYLWALEPSEIQIFALPLAYSTFNTVNAYSVAVAGNIAYLSSTGFYIFNVSNIASPQLLSTIVNYGSYTQLAASNNLVFGLDSNYYYIFNISNPVQLKLLSNTFTTPPIKAFVLINNLAYIISPSSALQIFNWSNINSPKLLGTLPGTTAPQDIAVYGNITLIADASSGLCVADTSNATYPKLLSTLAIPRTAQGIAAFENVAYIIDVESNIYVISIANTTAPKLLATIPSSSITRMIVSGNLGYTVGSSLQVFNLTDASNPRLIGSLLAYLSPSSVVIANNIAYVTSDAGLSIFDLTNFPWLNFPQTNSATTFLINFPYAITVNNNTINIWNITQANAIQYLGSWNAIIPPNQISIAGNKLFMGNSDGLTVVDITNPEDPQLLETVPCSQPVEVFAVDENQTVYLPDDYQCISQLSNVLTPCSKNQPLTLVNDIEIEKGQDKRLTPDEWFANCGTQLNPRTLFTITSISNAQLQKRNASEFWHNTTSVYGTDIFQNNVALLHNNSTNAPAFNFSVTDSSSTLTASANIKFSLNGTLPEILGVQLTINQNGITLINASGFDIQNAQGNQVGSLVITVTSATGGFFSTIDNPGTPVTQFNFYQILTGYIQFVHNSSALPQVNFSVTNGLNPTNSPLAAAFQFISPQPSPGQISLPIALGVTAAVLTAAFLSGFLFYQCSYKDKPNKVDDFNIRGYKTDPANRIEITKERFDNLKIGPDDQPSTPTPS